MKRAIFILTLGLCLLLSDGAHAQRALPAMRGLEIRGGMTDGFYTRDSRSETGYWFGLAMSHYAKNADKWVFGAEFLNRYYPYKSERIPVAQFTAEGGGLTGWSDPIYSQRLAESAQQTGSARCALLADCERQLLEGCAVVPLLGQNRRLLVADGITGLVFDPFTPVLDLTDAQKN